MNKWYGVRVPKSYSSEKNWYQINEYGGRLLLYWSVVIILIGIISLILPPLDETMKTTLSLVPLLLLVPTVQIFIYSNKL